MGADERRADLGLLTWAVSQNRDEIAGGLPKDVKQAIDDAIATQQFSRMEKMERLLKREQEEAEFLKMAMRLFLNA